MANRTKAQQKAIELRDKTLLISAAAGSGKTTVLIERIIRLLTDKEAPADISRLLIVTFTRAAASELRKRISTALSSAIAEDPKNKRLFKQLASLGSARISTIDAFYGDVVRRYSQQLGIPSSLRIADDSELLPIQKRIMNEIIDLGYEGELEDGNNIINPFASLADSLSDMRNDSELANIFLSLRKKLNSHPRSTEFLRDCADSYDNATGEDFFDTTYGGVIRKYVADQMEYLINILKDACRYFESGADFASAYLPAFESDLAFCEDIRNTIPNSSFASIREKFVGFSHESLGRLSASQKTSESDYFCELRNKTVKEKIKKLKEGYFGGDCNNDQLTEFAMRSAENCRVLYNVLSKFDELYLKEKLSRKICEFNDIKQWAFRLLVSSDGTPTSAALELSESFDAIYIDEYQDVDPIQDLIFRSIAKPASRFMVGDVKQSIYGFRGADPSLFMSYRSSFDQIDPESKTLPGGSDCTIFMSDNFRCDENVVRFANAVCSYTFTVGSKSISYTKGDNLIFSKLVPEGHISSPVTVALIEKSKDAGSEDGKEENTDEIKLENLEAEYIALEISRLIGKEKKADGSFINAGDIAVLSKSYLFCEKVSKALNKLGINNHGESDESIFDDPEVSLAHSLLEAIDNPQRDIHLASVLISPLFGFTADDLISIRELNRKSSLYDAVCAYARDEDSERDNPLTQKCISFIDELDTMRHDIIALPSDRIVQYIFSRFSLLSRDSGNGTSRKSLLRLYESARKFEGDEFKGLYSFLEYIDNSIENGTPIGAGASDPTDAVHLMTIHKSKGLEFPVCFVANCASPFNRDDLKECILYSAGLGVAMDLADSSGFGKIKTPYRRAMARNITDSLLEEDMRVLYVALTRARERLYVTATPMYGVDYEICKAAMRRKYSSRATVTDVHNYISWVLEALSGEDETFFKIARVGEKELIADRIEISVEEDEDESTIYDPAVLDSERQKVRSNFEFVYPYEHISSLPAKLSVSKLSPGVLDRNADSEEESDISASIDTDLPPLRSTPSFMLDEAEKATVSGAERGIATHTFLQFCNFERAARGGCAKELDYLVENGFMSRSARELVNIKQVDKFFSSRLFKRISTAKWIRREQRFNILLPAHLFTRDEILAEKIKDEKLLVQGVMDIFFESADGELILCDYKTDYLTKEEIHNAELAQKKLESAHSSQLSYYAEALHSMLGKYPDKVLIYSLPLGDTVEININKHLLG